MLYISNIIYKGPTLAIKLTSQKDQLLVLQTVNQNILLPVIAVLWNMELATCTDGLTQPQVLELIPALEL